jgi:ComF family protein
MFKLVREKLLHIIPECLSFIYKNQCTCCKQAAVCSICEDCRKGIKFNNNEPVRIFHDVKIYSAGIYTGNLRKLILSIKFYKRKDASTDLALFLYHYWKRLNPPAKIYEVIPVPVHRIKKKARGYDQSELVARKFCFLTGYKLNSRLLERIKDTHPQHNLSYDERKNNLAGAFKLNMKYHSQRPILLIDDICTSGATLSEAILACKRENLSDINILTISHAQLNKETNDII